MTKQEAISELRKGTLITHRLFVSGEYIILNEGRVIDEDGFDIGSLTDFMEDRQSLNWDTDWNYFIPQ